MTEQVVLIIKSHGGRFKDENDNTLYKELPCYEGISLKKITLVPRACSIKSSSQFFIYLSQLIREQIKRLLEKGLTFEIIMQQSQQIFYELFERLLVEYYKESDISTRIQSYPRWQQILLRANGFGEPLKEEEEEEYQSIKMSLFEFNSCENGKVGLYDKKFSWFGSTFDKTRYDDMDYVIKEKQRNEIFAAYTFDTQIVAAAREIKGKTISRIYDFYVYRKASEMLRKFNGVIPPREGEGFNWDELGRRTTLGWIYELYIGYGYKDISIIDLSCDKYSCEGGACRGGRKSKKCKAMTKRRKIRKRRTKNRSSK
jgi:hypothetical protein